MYFQSIGDLCDSNNDEASLGGTGSSNVAAVDMTRGSGLLPGTFPDTFGSSDWGSSDDPEEYIEFGVTVDPGFKVQLNELLIGTNSSDIGPGIIGVFTSLDSFTTPVAELSQSGSGFKYFMVDLLSLLDDTTRDFTIRLKEVGNTQTVGSSDTSDDGLFLLFRYDDGSGATTPIQITGSLVEDVSCRCCCCCCCC